MPGVSTPDADGSGGAVCVDVERGAAGEVTGAGCVAVGVGLGAEDAVDVVANHVVGGVHVGMAVCATEHGTERLVGPHYCL